MAAKLNAKLEPDSSSARGGALFEGQPVVAGIMVTNQGGGSVLEAMGLVAEGGSVGGGVGGGVDGGGHDGHGSAVGIVMPITQRDEGQGQGASSAGGQAAAAKAGVWAYNNFDATKAEAQAKATGAGANGNTPPPPPPAQPAILTLSRWSFERLYSMHHHTGGGAGGGGGGGGGGGRVMPVGPGAPMVAVRLEWQLDDIDGFADPDPTATGTAAGGKGGAGGGGGGGGDGAAKGVKGETDGKAKAKGQAKGPDEKGKGKNGVGSVVTSRWTSADATLGEKVKIGDIADTKPPIQMATSFAGGSFTLNVGRPGFVTHEHSQVGNRDQFHASNPRFHHHYLNQAINK